MFLKILERKIGTEKESKRKIYQLFGLEMEREIDEKTKDDGEPDGVEIIELHKKQFRKSLAVDTEYRSDITNTIPNKFYVSFILMCSQVKHLDTGSMKKIIPNDILIMMNVY